MRYLAELFEDPLMVADVQQGVAHFCQFPGRRLAHLAQAERFGGAGGDLVAEQVDTRAQTVGVSRQMAMQSEGTREVGWRAGRQALE
ncbi:MAG: hypothetical protein EA424_01275 [Planctomycetaceae bacterium]|nr:MAG: hypothetical protein EA424_01275 [Planctomycetaceae bacterium]